jgi:hypothetical protein
VQVFRPAKKGALAELKLCTTEYSEWFFGFRVTCYEFQVKDIKVKRVHGLEEILFFRVFVLSCFRVKTNIT